MSNYRVLDPYGREVQELASRHDVSTDLVRHLVRVLDADRARIEAELGARVDASKLVR